MLWRGLLTVAVVVVAVGGAIGFLGRIHPAFDSFSHFRHHAALAGGVLAVVALVLLRGRARLFAISALALAVICALSVRPFFFGANHHAIAASAAERTLLQMNLFRVSDHEPAQRLVERLTPDIITLQEVSDSGKAMMADLAGLYPHQELCIDGNDYGIAILSQHPFAPTPATCEPLLGFVNRTVLMDGEPISVVSQHIQPPWPYGQADTLRELQHVLPTLEPPLIVGGDFNAAPWSAALSRYGKWSRTRPVEGIGGTWTHFLMPAALVPVFGLPIDNIFVSEGIDVVGAQTLEPTASDHLPILLQFTRSKDARLQ